MCTVSIVPEADGFRLLCNRDERRSRATALPPQRHQLATGVALYPVDPVGGGTWVGVNDAGLAVTLLNRTLPGGAPPSARLLSRGRTVTRLLACRTTEAAIDAGLEIDLATFNPFRVTIVSRGSAATLSSDGRVPSVESIDLSRPFMQTSSSLGDDMVAAPRTGLFDRLVVAPHRAGDGGAVLAGQTRFHAHHWRDRGLVSVVMSRVDACTVSRTTIRVSGGRIEMYYDPLDGSAVSNQRLA